MAQADTIDTTKPPAKPQDALYRRTDISPETFFQALGRVRRAARDEIERLIAWLDSTIDCDEDSAVDDDPCDDRELEPSLGSFDRMSDQIKAWQGGNYDVDAELDNSDREPSLGSVGDVHFNQERWSKGDSRDIEIDDGDSGVADLDGLLEQVGCGGWQGDRTGMG
jgi:hypothetical protein